MSTAVLLMGAALVITGCASALPGGAPPAKYPPTTPTSGESGEGSAGDRGRADPDRSGRRGSVRSSEIAGPSNVSATLVAIRAQAEHALVPQADAAPIGLTIECRVTSDDPELPIAVSPDLRVIEARDSDGRDLGSYVRPSNGPPRWVAATDSADTTGRSRVPTTLVSARCFGMEGLAPRLSSFRGEVRAWVVSQVVDRDLSSSRLGEVLELVTGLEAILRRVDRNEVSSSVEIELRASRAGAERGVRGFGDALAVPQIMDVELIDQTGASMGRTPVLGGGFVAPSSGDRSRVLVVSVFTTGPSQRVASARVRIATSIQPVTIEVSAKDLPLAER
jgi:hypothetical protein